jgi:hypothetical protein
MCGNHRFPLNVDRKYVATNKKGRGCACPAHPSPLTTKSRPAGNAKLIQTNHSTNSCKRFGLTCKKVKNGRYNNPNEVEREALRPMKDEDQRAGGLGNLVWGYFGLRFVLLDFGFEDLFYEM